MKVKDILGNKTLSVEAIAAKHGVPVSDIEKERMGKEAFNTRARDEFDALVREIAKADADRAWANIKAAQSQPYERPGPRSRKTRK